MATVKDPICGKDVDTLRARAVGIYGGVTYYFCSQECKAKYVDPRKTPRGPEPTKPMPLPNVKPAAMKEPTPTRKDPTPSRKDPTPPPRPERRDPSLEELPPMAETSGGDDDALPDLTPAKPRAVHSPSVIAEVRELKKSNRVWVVIIVILAALVVAAAVLSLRHP